MGLAETLKPSFLSSNGQNWITAPELTLADQKFESGSFVSSATHLLANPNLTSSHLFRADILFDSAGILKTPKEKELGLEDHTNCTADGQHEKAVESLPAPGFNGFTLNRTTVRRFIPRNQKWDAELDQTCLFYSQTITLEEKFIDLERSLLLYLPHFSSEEQVPFYHPPVLALGFLYEFSKPSHGSTSTGKGALSLHFIPFASGIPKTLPYRLQRTLLGLLSAQARLARNPSATTDTLKSTPKTVKDNIVPQHVLQNTYVRLKEKYASSLIDNWAEVTEPSKHVFEDIIIAAFLIELWRIMYGSSPPQELAEHEGAGSSSNSFPGFVDIACGNGVLVFLLHQEGYKGCGFDARRRKSWTTYPKSTQQYLRESICIPSIFQEALPNFSKSIPETVQINNGIFNKDTFLIANHADELTVWTPILGALGNPTCPLPFLAIPCCSHSLSGSRFRYPPPKKPSNKSKQDSTTESTSPSISSGTIPSIDTEIEQEPDQPGTGDLKALRTLKLAERETPDLPTTMYGALTAKTISIASELGYGEDIERTLMRIPSTRNIGILGGLKAWKGRNKHPKKDWVEEAKAEAEERIRKVVERETMKDGGLEAAARMWIERSLGLQDGNGKGVKGQHG